MKMKKTDLTFDMNMPWDATMMFSCTYGNYNGDPDMGGRPRQDLDTEKGLVTDVCLSHKVRMKVVNSFNQEAPNRVLVVPNTYRQKFYSEMKDISDEENDTVSVICNNFWDVRVFGSVFAWGGEELGSLTGPIKFSTLSVSLDPVTIMDISITTCAPARDKERNGKMINKKTDIGEKYAVPFALFKTHIWYIPEYAKLSGITNDDVNIFFGALLGIFDSDRSTMRGEMAIHSLDIFKHSSELRNARFQDIKGLISVNKDQDIEFPRSFSDYSRSFDENSVPEGIEHINLLNDWK